MGRRPLMGGNWKLNPRKVSDAVGLATEVRTDIHYLLIFQPAFRNYMNELSWVEGVVKGKSDGEIQMEEVRKDLRWKFIWAWRFAVSEGELEGVLLKSKQNAKLFFCFHKLSLKRTEISHFYEEAIEKVGV